HNEGKVSQVLLHGAHVALQLDQTLKVLFQFLRGGIHDEDNAVSTVEDSDACALIEHLTWDRIEVEANIEAMDRAQVKREEVEEQRTLALGGDGEQITVRLLWGMIVYVLQVGGLAAVPGAIIDNLAVNLTTGNVNKGHSALILG